MKVSVIFFFLSFSFLCFLSSCEPPQMQTAKVFRYNQSSGIASLDPAFSKDQSTIWACNQLFNGLVQLNDSLAVMPAIANVWSVTDSGKTYTFQLRKDVSFHQDACFKVKARNVNAFDFVYSLNRILDPKIASPGAWIFSEHVVKENPFRAIDSFTFQIRLRKPFLPLMGILTMQYCSVIPKEAVDFYGPEFRAHPVGTGPFQFKKWREGVALILVKNSHYFERNEQGQMPFIDGVKISFITDKKSEFLAFKKKEIDFVSGLDVSYMDEVLDKSGNLNAELSALFNLSKSPYLNTEYLGFNLEKQSKNQAKIREAINLGINREEVILYLRKGVGKPAENGFVPMGLPSFDYTKKWVSYQPQKAALLLEKMNAEEKKITLFTNETYREIGLLVAKQLSKIGLEVKVEVHPSAILREWMVKGDAPFFRGSWIADYPDAESYYAVFYGKNTAPPNYTRFKNNAYDAIYETALRESDNQKRYVLYHQLDEIIATDIPVIPLYYDEVLRFYQKNIEGLNTNGLNLLNLKTIKIN